MRPNWPLTSWLDMFGMHHHLHQHPTHIHVFKNATSSSTCLRSLIININMLVMRSNEPCNDDDGPNSHSKRWHPCANNLHPGPPWIDQKSGHVNWCAWRRLVGLNQWLSYNLKYFKPWVSFLTFLRCSLHVITANGHHDGTHQSPIWY